MLEKNKIYNADCLAGMEGIADQSIDMILCDLPYGVTDCRWDSVLPFDKLWKQYERIIKDDGAIVLTAIQPFTTALIQSNRKLFRYCWYWHKNCPTGFANAKKQPMRCIEDVVVFYKKPPIYNPQGLIRLDKPIHHKGSKKCGEVYSHGLESDFVTEYINFPRNLLSVKCERGLHPTQKPTALFEYLIRTYTNEGELVLDNCMGSGTTAVACIRSNRDFIGFELDAKHFGTAQNRIESELAKKK